MDDFYFIASNMQLDVDTTSTIRYTEESMNDVIKHKIIRHYVLKNNNAIDKNTVYLYHGGPVHTEVLKPIAPDFGNLLDKSGFSLFCWMDKEKAIQWAAFKSIMDFKKERRSSSLELHCMYNPRDCKTIMDRNTYDYFMNCLRSDGSGLSAFVYTLTVNINEIGLGNDSTHHEFTVRKTVEPVSVDIIDINSHTLKNYIQICGDVSDYKSISTKQFVNNRGFLPSMLFVNDYGYQRLQDKSIIDLLFPKDKSLDYSSIDNLDDYLHEHRLKFHKVTPWTRLKMEFDKNKYIRSFECCIENSTDDMLLEAVDVNTHFIIEKLYPRVEAVLSTPQGDRKFKQIVGSYMDKNSQKLHTSGPTTMIAFGDIDKAQYFGLFKIEPKEVQSIVDDITNQFGSKSDFKLLRGNPIFWIFYCCMRYYTIKKDEKGLNTALAIYALSAYPSIYSMFFKYQPNEAVMQYTMDNLSEKYLMKQGGHVFGGLFLSIKHSYEFLKPYMQDGSDKEIIRFIQRIRNDQKSMIKNICDQYMQNHKKGLRVKLTKDSYDEVQLDVDSENNTTIVEVVSNNIVNQIITNGLDLKRVTQCKDLANIGLADCRFYLSKIVTVKYTDEIQKFVHSILFLYLYDEHKSREDINSTNFLVWSSELFRKTNSNNDNIQYIKDTLNKWGEETGVHDKFKREASRVSYKKAIFWYFILSIQYYNK